MVKNRIVLYICLTDSSSYVKTSIKKKNTFTRIDQNLQFFKNGLRKEYYKSVNAEYGITTKHVGFFLKSRGYKIIRKTNESNQEINYIEYNNLSKNGHQNFCKQFNQELEKMPFK